MARRNQAASPAATAAASADVIVIGGGFSGLSAALYAQAAGASVIVLEARDRVGGRTCTQVLESGVRADVGGAYVGSTQDRLLRMADRYGIETYKVYAEGKFVCELDGRRMTHAGTIPPVNPLALLDVNNLFRETYKLTAAVNSEEPWKGKVAEELDTMSVHDWMNKHMWTSDGKKLFKVGIRTLFCAEPTELSVLYAAFYMKSCGGLLRGLETNGGAQERKFKQGSATICERMAEELGLGTRVILSAPVQTVAHDEQGVRITVRDGRVFSARRAILALAPSMYGKFQYEPVLPALRMQLCQRMPMGSIIKTVMYYRTAFWREDGYNGMALCDRGPVLYTFDDTNPDGSHPAIMGFVITSDAREFCELPELERKKRIAAQYARIFQNEEALRPVGYVDKNWMAEEFTGGCYVGLMGPGVMSQYAQQLRLPINRLHFAGTETATKWAGYMDGAIEAGERAAYEVLKELAREGVRVKVPASPPTEEPPSKTIPHVPCEMSKVEKLLPGVKHVVVASVVAAVAVAAAFLM